MSLNLIKYAAAIGSQWPCLLAAILSSYSILKFTASNDLTLSTYSSIENKIISKIFSPTVSQKLKGESVE